MLIEVTIFKWIPLAKDRKGSSQILVQSPNFYMKEQYF